MSLRSTYTTDKTAEVEGKWFDIGVNEDDGSVMRIRLARMGKANKRYMKEVERKVSPHRDAIERETMPTGLADRIMREVFVDTVLLDWEGIRASELSGNDEDKAPLKFNRDNALKLFEALPDMYDDWEAKARKSSSFREAQLEQDAKN